MKICPFFPAHAMDVKKAIKFKLDNKEQRWKKQSNELNKKD
jgi:hypothetical protein